jgi:hypothetical protein
MDFTGMHVKVNLIVGKHTGKSLGNAAHFQAVNAGTTGRESVGFGHGAILKIPYQTSEVLQTSEVFNPFYGSVTLMLPSMIP